MKNLQRSFDIENVQEDYPALLRHILAHGEDASPRAMQTKEIFDVVMRLNPHRAIITGIDRKLSTKLISLEALQLISCTSMPARTVKAAPNMASFMNGETFHGPYGTRIGAQLEAAIKRLKSDENSRQAVITIWDPLLDAFRSVQAKDVPCTTMLQFFIRNDKLVLHVTMRSNDAWWGTPHDWGQLSQLQLAMANVLGIEAGDYYHHAVSLHLYERDYEKVDTLTAPTSPLIEHDGFGWSGISFEEIQSRALGFMTDVNNYTPSSCTEEWHAKQQISIDQL